LANFSNFIQSEQQCFITLKPQDKKPVQTDWLNNGQTFDAAHVLGHNVGILSGKLSGILDVDLDCTEAVSLADAILPKPHATFGRGAPDSLHYLYRGNSFGPRRAFTSTGSNNATLVELRGDGSQTMIPPSIHPNGEQLTWIETNQEQNDISYEDLLKHVSLLAAASELMPYWVEGQRHTLALGFSGLCLKQGVNANLVMKIIQRICKVMGDPEVEDRLNAIRTSFNQPAHKNAGFTKLKEALGETVAKSISERVCFYTGKQSSAEIIPHMQSFTDIIELGQFVDRANVTEAKMGQAFSQWLSGKALYVIETKRWMIWNGRYWEVELCNKMHNLAFDYVQAVKSTLIEQNSIHGLGISIE
jgi:putative DNA primase/helicase